MGWEQGGRGLTDLDRLIEAVKVGLPSPTNWRNFAAMEGDDADGTPFSILAHRAYHGSLDAAKRLHEALLPGWAWCIEIANAAEVWPRGKLTAAIRAYADEGNPARAWLLAILQAVKAREGK